MRQITKIILGISIVVVLIMALFFFSETVVKKKQFLFTKVVSVEKSEIFEVMSDLENYPKIFPKRITDVEIIQRNGSSSSAYMTISEGRFSDRVFLTQNIGKDELNYSIVEGNAKGTKILTFFESVDKGTKITSHIDLQIRGPLSVVLVVLSEGNFRSAFGTAIDAFEDYALAN